MNVVYSVPASLYGSDVIIFKCLNTALAFAMTHFSDSLREAEEHVTAVPYYSENTDALELRKIDRGAKND